MNTSTTLRFGHLGLWSTLAYLLVLPLLPVSSAGNWHDVDRCAQGLLFVLVLPSVRLHLWRARPLLANRWLYLGALALLCLASCLHADAPIVAAREVALMLGIVMVAVAVATSVKAGASETAAMGIVLAAALYAGLFLLLMLMALGTGLGVDNYKLVFGYDNPRFLNHAQTVMVPLLVGVLAMPSLARPWRWLAWLALAGHCSLLMLTLGRATMLALLVLGVVAATCFGREGRRYAGRLVLAALLGAGLYAVVFRALPKLLGHPLRDSLNAVAGVESDHSRLYLWRMAARFIADSPLLGIGPMHFAHHPNPIAAHPHNFYLQVAAEYGLPFALLVFGGLASGLIRYGLVLRQRMAQDPVPLAIGAFCACVGVSVDAMFSGNLVMPMAQIWVAMAAGLLIGLGKPIALIAGGPARASVLLRVLAVALVLGELGAIGLMAQDWHSRQAHEPTTAQAGKGSQAFPRFWLDGWF